MKRYLQVAHLQYMFVLELRKSKYSSEKFHQFKSVLVNSYNLPVIIAAIT